MINKPLPMGCRSCRHHAAVHRLTKAEMSPTGNVYYQIRCQGLVESPAGLVPCPCKHFASWDRRSAPSA